MLSPSRAAGKGSLEDFAGKRQKVNADATNRGKTYHNSGRPDCGYRANLCSRINSRLYNSQVYKNNIAVDVVEFIEHK